MFNVNVENLTFAIIFLTVVVLFLFFFNTAEWKVHRNKGKLGGGVGVLRLESRSTQFGNCPSLGGARAQIGFSFLMQM